LPLPMLARRLRGCAAQACLLAWPLTSQACQRFVPLPPDRCARAAGRANPALGALRRWPAAGRLAKEGPGGSAARDVPRVSVEGHKPLPRGGRHRRQQQLGDAQPGRAARLLHVSSTRSRKHRFSATEDRPSSRPCTRQPRAIEQPASPLRHQPLGQPKGCRAGCPGASADPPATSTGLSREGAHFDGDHFPLTPSRATACRGAATIRQVPLRNPSSPARKAWVLAANHPPAVSVAP